MDDIASQAFFQGCQDVAKQAGALMKAIERCPHLPMRDMLRAQTYVVDASVLIFHALPETPFDRARDDKQFQAFKSVLMMRPKRTRRPAGKSEAA